MCGRAALGLSDQQLVALFSSRPLPPPQQQQYRPSWNIRPTTATPIVRRPQGRNELVLLNWGISLPNNTSKHVINARCEGIRQKPMFRSLLDTQRCVMPVVAYYEWAHKRPYLIKTGGDQPAMNLACLYTNADTFVIITCRAAPAIAQIHDRMPVVLAHAQLDRWLDVDRYSFADCEELLAPFNGELEFWQVNPLRGNDESCIRPAVSGQASIASYLNASNDDGRDRKRPALESPQQQRSPKKVKPELPHDSKESRDKGKSEKNNDVIKPERISSPKPKRKSSSPKPADQKKQPAITDFFQRQQQP